MAGVTALSHFLSDTVVTNAPRQISPSSLPSASFSTTPALTTPFRSTSLRHQSVAKSSYLMSPLALSPAAPAITPVTHLSSSASVSTYGAALASRTPIMSSHRKATSHTLPQLSIPSLSISRPSLARNTTPEHMQPVMHRASGTSSQEPVGWFDIGGHIYGYDINGDIVVDDHGTPILYDGDYDPISGTLITQGEAVDNPIGSAWIMLIFACIYTAIRIRKNRKELYI